MKNVIVAGIAALALVGCGAKEEVAVEAEAAPVVETAPEAAPPEAAVETAPEVAAEAAPAEAAK